MTRSREMKPVDFKPVREITQFGTVLDPHKSEPPILAPAIRAAVRQWLVEVGCVEELAAVGLEPRRSAMLAGPPGCGKTTLAHHLAARLGLPLVLIDMSALVSMYVGESSRNVLTLFRAVNEQADSLVLLLDEFDAIATKRTNGGTSAGKEQNAILVSLLQHIDQFTGTLIAATNKADSVDPAIWRRFGMHLTIDEPDDESRFAILTRYLAPFRLADEAMDVICEYTAGASPAVLRQLMEGVKRDLILSPRFNQPIGARDIFERLKVSVQPHADVTLPLLWREPFALERIAKIEWPPILQPREEKAA